MPHEKFSTKSIGKEVKAIYYFHEDPKEKLQN